MGRRRSLHCKKKGVKKKLASKKGKTI